MSSRLKDNHFVNKFISGKLQVKFRIALLSEINIDELMPSLDL